jgi:hypothetical protein
MDNPFINADEQLAGSSPLDYKVIYDMLQSCVDFKYTQNHILSDGVIRIILAELEYWHSLAERLLKEKIGG